MTRASIAQRLGVHMLLGVAGRAIKIGRHWAPNCATCAFATNPLSPDRPNGIPTIILSNAARLRTFHPRVVAIQVQMMVVWTMTPIPRGRSRAAS